MLLSQELLPNKVNINHVILENNGGKIHQKQKVRQIILVPPNNFLYSCLSSTKLSQYKRKYKEI